MKNYKILLSVVGLLSCTSVFANTTTASSVIAKKKISQIHAQASNVIAKKKESQVAASAVKQGFAIPSGNKLTVALLDECWDKRQDKLNQKIIADYLMSEPEVPNNYEIAWKTARLVSFIGNFGVGEDRFVKSKEGVKLFSYGANAGKIAYKLEPNKVEGYYWYATDLGSYGLAKGILSAASNAGDGMDALKKAKAIDPTYEAYGSSRILGRYYQELPKLFGGNMDKAFDLFEEAVKKAPKFANNWIYLGHYYLKDKNYTNALDACKNALAVTSINDGKFEDLKFKREAKDCINKAKDKLK